MSMKRVVSAAAVAAGLSISAVTLNAGSAFAAPLDPPPPCPNCHGGGGGGGNPGGGGGGGNPGGAG
ncbi:MAG: MAP_0585 family protein, partial [Mycobacterium sp.]